MDKETAMNKKRIAPVAFKILAFLAAALLILWAFPREGQFRYHFEEGQPWKYGLLTAPYNFPVYKAEDALQAERDSVLNRFEPYVQFDASRLDKVLAQLEDDYKAYLCVMVPEAYLTYLKSQLKLIYRSGIISAAQFEAFEKEQVPGIMMVNGKLAEHRSLSSLFTAKKAYTALLANLPAGIDADILTEECKIENYLSENCAYDKTTSSRRREELLATVSETHGMVQRDERIIDQGEIVSESTFLKLQSLKRASQQRSAEAGSRWVLAGQAVWTLMMLVFLFVFLRLYSRPIYNKLPNIIFVLILIVVLSALASLVIRNNDLLNIYMVPFALIPIMLCTFFDGRTAFFTTLIALLICAPVTPFPFEFLMLQMAMTMVVLLTMRDLTQRSQLAVCILQIFVIYCLAYTSMSMLEQGGVDQVQWKIYVSFGVNALLLLTSYLLVYLSEQIFGFTSNVTLMELANVNTPLLREFSETCPGTFQHSLQVSNLAAAAVAAIGGNALLVRTGALYHDLGKMVNPQYFTENQDGVNPLSQMSSEQAARCITGHVTEGLELARKRGLPQVLRDFISTHHGAGPARYFYTLFKNEHPDEQVPSCYYYPGPDPFTRETAVLMMADTVEAASRSLKEYSEEAIDHLVETLIGRQVSEGAFRQTPLTFQDIETVKQVMKNKLHSIYHTRIAYPKEAK